MTDLTKTGATDQTPDAGAGSAQAETPDAGATPAGQSTTEHPFAVFPTPESFQKRLDREARQRLDGHAQELGFENWQAYLDSRNQEPEPPQAGAQADTAPEPGQPDGEQPAATLDEAARLRLAIEIGGDRGLPPALLTRLQGNSREELEADADRLLSVVQSGPRGPGVPRVRQSGNQSTTFTRSQMQDPAFVRANAQEIQRAAREGRIVDA
jgi:hypothetical protein